MTKLQALTFMWVVGLVLSLATPIGICAKDTDAHTDACCAEMCAQCFKMCTDKLAYCKEKGGKHADPKHLQVLEDCASMCRTSSDFQKRESPNKVRVAAICKDLCTACADSCEALNDPKLKDCVEQCRKCAEHCKSVAGS